MGISTANRGVFNSSTTIAQNSHHGDSRVRAWRGAGSATLSGDIVSPWFGAIEREDGMLHRWWDAVLEGGGLDHLVEPRPTAKQAVVAVVHIRRFSVSHSSCVHASPSHGC